MKKFLRKLNNFETFFRFFGTTIVKAEFSSNYAGGFYYEENVINFIGYHIDFFNIINNGCICGN